MHLPRFIPAFACLLICFGHSAAKADLIVNLSGSSGSSSMTVDFSGELTAVGNTLSGFIVQDLPTYLTSSFADSLITGDAQVDIFRPGTGFITTALITDIRASDTQSFIVNTNDIFVQAGDSFQFSGGGTFTPTGLTFDDFSQGSFAGNVLVDGSGSATINVVNAVPEPSSLALCFGAGLLMSSLRRRRIVPSDEKLHCGHS